MSARYTAFIPVRGGSKSIPLKNVRLMAGRPLVHWAIRAADGCDRISQIVVSTDSPEIERAALAYGSQKVEIHRRSEASATDTANTERVMLEYAGASADFDAMVLIQATSPLITAGDLDRGIDLFESGSYASVLSGVRQKRFVWDVAADGSATPANYDFTARPRRQDFSGMVVENGAFYVTSRESLLSTGCRLSAPVGLVEMDEASYFEIDEPSDWAIVEGLLAARLASSAMPAAASRIRAVFSDCDGVLTDGGMYYSEAGDEIKKFRTRDGVGFAMLRNAGIVTGIITSESVELVKRRAAKLQLDECVLGAKDKLAAIDELCAKHGIGRDEVCYIGDDVMDATAIGAVGLGCSVSDGVGAAKAAAAYITHAAGGTGAVRELAEMILAARGA